MKLGGGTNSREDWHRKGADTAGIIKNVLAQLCDCDARVILTRPVEHGRWDGPQPPKGSGLKRKRILPPAEHMFAHHVRTMASTCRCPKPPVPYFVVVSRLAPGRLDRGNLPGATKVVEDAICRWLQVDDREDGRINGRITLRRAQLRSPEQRVRIRIEGRTPEVVLAWDEIERVADHGAVALAAWNAKQHRAGR